MPAPIVDICAAVIFALALIHTFSVSLFGRLAHSQPRHAGLWHLLGEVEVVFGFWAAVLMVLLYLANGKSAVINYLESRNFTEPMFVFAIMVIAGTRPVLAMASLAVTQAARALPLPRVMAIQFLVLALVPLLGSFITEPAAMTVAALLLRDACLREGTSERLKYATLGVLFVNVSIGGTLTPFAAPPVLMVAGQWGWDFAFMLQTFGWKAALAVTVNAAAVSFIFRRELGAMAPEAAGLGREVPLGVMAVHVLFLAAIVAFAHYPVIFIPALLFFLGYATAYPRHQGRLILREALLVAFFLAGLVVLAGQQQWWLQPLLARMDADAVFYGATALTAVVDNAAITYLGSLVEGLSDEFKVALVAGAVTGGGLTIIANAPNPAGSAILRDRFANGAISPLALFIAAVPPTLVAALAFRLL
jgi:hypothetical protein